MKESGLAKRFNVELERINTKQYESNDEPILSIPLDGEGTLEELSPMVDLAETMIATDYSGESQIKASLLGRLLQRFQEQKSDSTNHKPRPIMELSNDELDRVAGGLTNLDAQGASCSLCECRQPAVTIVSENCPNCGHSRSVHK